MATKVERFDSLLTALLNDVPTTGFKNKVRDSFKMEFRYEIQKRGINPDTMTNAQEMSEVLNQTKAWIRDIIKRNDPDLVAAENTFAAVQTAVVNAADSALPSD